LQNEENYVKQLKYVDVLVGRFLAELEQQASFATSDIIILSDHGYRAMAPKGQAYHVPLLIKRAGQVMRRDHDAPVQTEVILRGLVNDTADTGLEDRVETRRS
jgi:arylsulfatase A-like enzyme